MTVCESQLEHGIIEARKYLHVYAVMCNGQHTARWSMDKTTGTWYVSKGWKIPNRAQPLNADQSAFVSGLVGLSA